MWEWDDFRQSKIAARVAGAGTGAEVGEGAGGGTGAGAGEVAGAGVACSAV